jgi:hypothetical protein
MNLFDKFQPGLPYTEFLARYATDDQKNRWRQVHEEIVLTGPQRQLLASFHRQMNVLCLAGAWCGDCINQCPAFDHFATAAPVIHLRFLDRDDHADVQRELQINGGNRVPVLVFFSEDGFEVARYGERTLSTYRQLMRDQAGPSCPTSLPDQSPERPHQSPERERGDLLSQVTQDWLNEFERVQWLLQLSPRLRQKYGD